MSLKFVTSAKKRLVGLIVLTCALFILPAAHANPTHKYGAAKLETPDDGTDSAKSAVASQQKELKLGPIPARDNLNIYLNTKAVGPVDIRVIDMNGRVVILKNATAKQSESWHDQINVSQMASGLYFIELFVGGDELVSKFVKLGL